MKKQWLIHALVLMGIVMSTSCKRDEEVELKEENKTTSVAGRYSNGAFICNEGSFQKSNSTVSFYDFTKDEIVNDIFSAENNKEQLGDVLQSGTRSGDKIYLVVNNSNKIVVVNAGDFKKVATIEGVNQPRYMAIVGSKGYVTQWDANGTVAVVDLSTNKVTKTIDVGAAPEGIVVVNNKIFVANSGGYGADSTVSVIDPTSDAVVKTVKVGDIPRNFVVDADNNVWVLCAGAINYDKDYNIVSQSSSKLVQLNGVSFDVAKEVVIGQEQHPMNLAISKDKNTIYYGGGYYFKGISSLAKSATTVKRNAFVGADKSFYGFNVNPKNGEIYALDACGYSGDGKMVRYSATGSLIKEYTVSLSPNGVIF